MLSAEISEYPNAQMGEFMDFRTPDSLKRMRACPLMLRKAQPEIIVELVIDKRRLVDGSPLPACPFNRACRIAKLMVQANSDSASVVHDSMFYHEDIIIQVENVLFRVNRGAFLQSNVFSDMFALPTGEGTECEGSSDQQPLRLEGYLAEDFRQFLRVLVPMHHDAEILTHDQWISVLKLATVWNFRGVRKTAIHKLDKYAAKDPVQRLIVCKQYKILRWLVPTINELARRPARLDIQDVRRLEVLGDRDMVLDLVLKIAGARERPVSNRAYQDFSKHITDLFKCDSQGRDVIYEGSTLVEYALDSDWDN